MDDFTHNDYANLEEFFNTGREGDTLLKVEENDIGEAYKILFKQGDIITVNAAMLNNSPEAGWIMNAQHSQINLSEQPYLKVKILEQKSAPIFCYGDRNDMSGLLYKTVQLYMLHMYN